MTTADRISAALAGRYRVEREVGAGGMATVFLAHDEKHDREVAIKVLHPELGAALGGERFLAEIKTTAKLQHPHILPLLDSGEADALLYYVMPFVPGETLRARLERERQLPIDDAVRIAREIADALGAAHAVGIVHRDIKPENILLQSGHALVADFGIALAVQQAGGARMTQTGLSLGTPQYMSPEQAVGDKHVDARADIYALGAVTYEMLTGEPPFTGASVQAIVAKVMNAEPEAPTLIRKTIPPGVEAAVLRALAKLPADRPSTAAEFATSLAGTAAATTSFPGGLARSTPLRLWQGIAAAALVVAASSLVMSSRRPLPAPRVVRFALQGASTRVGNTTQPSVSPDGRAVAYSISGGATPGIRLRWLDRDEADIVPETATASDVVFSPDGRQLAFLNTEGQIRIVPVSGGPTNVLGQHADVFSGLSWGKDGYVYFSLGGRDGGIARVAATGGVIDTLVLVPGDSISPTGEGRPEFPLVLDGTLIYQRSGSGRHDGEIFAVDVRSRASTKLVRGSAPLDYRDGWLVYSRTDGSVVAQRFDRSARTVSGTAVPLFSGVAVKDGRPNVAVGPDGTLIYQPTTSTLSQLVSVSRLGVETAIDSTMTRAFAGVAVSPDGSRLAATIEANEDRSAIWVYDLARHTLVRLTAEGELAFRPEWTPDGSRVLFSSDHGSKNGQRSLFAMRADGSDSMHLVVASPRHAQEISWSARGNMLAFRDGFDDGRTRRDIYALPVGDTTRRVVVATKADEFNPAVSPDGKWLAFASDESGRNEVYVTRFPEGGARQQVSTDGGSSPVWAHDGRTLFFRSVKGMIVATDVDLAKPSPAGASRILFDASRYYFDANGRSFDLATSGDAFLLVKPPPRASMNVVVDWWAEASITLAKARR
ncbi:MAG TPA: protein kinase [Gemmatimonadaceae bacterium]|nr:protein kinase [Gemmatimonadaceae bacterium]